MKYKLNIYKYTLLFRMKEFKCNACDQRFQNLVEYELHYNDFHHYYCAECKKVRPTARLLEIHIQETHDSFFKVLSERQPMVRNIFINSLTVYIYFCNSYDKCFSTNVLFPNVI